MGSSQPSRIVKKEGSGKSEGNGRSLYYKEHNNPVVALREGDRTRFPGQETEDYEAIIVAGPRRDCTLDLGGEKKAMYFPLRPDLEKCSHAYEGQERSQMEIVTHDLVGYARFHASFGQEAVLDIDGHLSHAFYPEPTHRGGLFHALYDAYCRHLNVVLWADMLLFHLTSNISKKINDFGAKHFRGVLVTHKEGKKAVEVIINGLEGENLYSFLNDLVEKMKKDCCPGVVEAFVPQFSTTDSLSRAIACSAVMDAVKKFFDFHGSFLCGIKGVYLLGEPEDYDLLLGHVDALASIFGTLPSNDEEARKMSKKKNLDHINPKLRDNNMAVFACNSILEFIYYYRKFILMVVDTLAGRCPVARWDTIVTHQRGEGSSVEHYYSGFVNWLLGRSEKEEVSADEVRIATTSVDINIHYPGRKSDKTMLCSGIEGIRVIKPESDPDGRGALAPCMGMALFKTASPEKKPMKGDSSLFMEDSDVEEGMRS